MKILVTGATGLIGSHLIPELLKNELNQVVATSRDIGKAEKFDWFTKVKYFEYDLNNSTNEDLYSFFDKPYSPKCESGVLWSSVEGLKHLSVTKIAEKDATLPEFNKAFI